LGGARQTKGGNQLSHAGELVHSENSPSSQSQIIKNFLPIRFGHAIMEKCEKERPIKAAMAFVVFWQSTAFN
jgi:hypothetical protein